MYSILVLFAFAARTKMSTSHAGALSLAKRPLNAAPVREATEPRAPFNLERGAWAPFYFHVG